MLSRAELQVMNKWPGRCSTGKKSACWDVGFGGINMFSEADEADFESAREAGITVVRFGAVGDAQDFRYLWTREGEHSLVCEHTINRLAAGIQRAADHGIKVIIALGHVPGRIFAQEAEQYDFRLWCSPEYGDRFAALWGALARNLRHFENVVGYDLLNEPFTPDDVAQGYFDEMPSTYVGTLNALYRKDHRGNSRMGFRDADHPRIDLLGESAHVASSCRPTTMTSIVYSFHMYAPPGLYDARTEPFPLCLSRPGQELARLQVGRFDLLGQRDDQGVPGGGESSGSSSTKSRTGISSSVNAASAARLPAPSAISSTCSIS